MKYSEIMINRLINNIINQSYCPDDFDLEVKDFENECSEERKCEDCWNEALKD